MFAILTQAFKRSPSAGCLALVTIGLIVLPAAPARAQGQLQFFKNYFVTGDYTSNGVGLRGKGVNGLASGAITISGVPDKADILAAFLYWQTMESTEQSSSSGGYFGSLPVSGLSIGPSNAPSCWGSGGGSGTTSGASHLRVYRTDVLRYLPIDSSGTAATNPNYGRRIANGTYTVSVPDSGSGGSQSPSSGNQVSLAEGASLVVVYRTSDLPLRAVVIYDGARTSNQDTPVFTQTIEGFYQPATTKPDARMTFLVGDGDANFQEMLTIDSQSSIVNPFVGSKGFAWDNLTYPVSAPGTSVTARVAPVVSSVDCLSWAAIVFGTNVQDTDGDGLLDVWESTSGLHDPAGNALPDLPAMGADPNTKDLFVEIDYMATAGWTNGGAPAHTHKPDVDALNMVARAFHYAPWPINIHFDAGAGFPTPPANCKNTWTSACAYVPSSKALGGDSIDEQACASCAYSAYPGTVTWKNGFRQYKEDYFDPARKDIFHYALFAHALGIPSPTDSHRPRNSSGIADALGGDLMVTLGLWDDYRGSTFMQASTLMHELGHNLGLRHAGVSALPNCKPNYQSVMNYLFQVRGLTVGTADAPIAGNVVGEPTIDYSRQSLPLLNETALNETNALGATTTMLYWTRWYAPLATSFLDYALHTAYATRHCDGSVLTQAEVTANVQMVRVDGISTKNIDWNGDGDTVDTIGTPGQDINFNGSVSSIAAGSNDWANLKLNQIGGRRNVGGKVVLANGTTIVGAVSLDLGQGDLGQGDLGQGDLGQGDLGQGDLGQGDLGQGDLGQGDLGQGDLGQGDLGQGDLGQGDLGTDTRVDVDLTTATSLGNAPNALRATASKDGITLKWSPPHVNSDKVQLYELYRVVGPAVTATNFPVVSPPPPLKVVVEDGGPAPDPDTTYLDGTAKNNEQYTYFPSAQFEDGQRSGPSNFKTITKK